MIFRTSNSVTLCSQQGHQRLDVYGETGANVTLQACRPVPCPFPGKCVSLRVLYLCLIIQGAIVFSAALDHPLIPCIPEMDFPLLYFANGAWALILVTDVSLAFHRYGYTRLIMSTSKLILTKTETCVCRNITLTSGWYGILKHLLLTHNHENTRRTNTTRRHFVEQD